MLNINEALKQHHQSAWSDYQTGSEASRTAVGATTEHEYRRNEAWSHEIRPEGMAVGMMACRGVTGGL